MNATIDTQPTDAPPLPNPNAMSDEQYAKLLAVIERAKNIPGYFERWDEQLAEVRQQIEEQAERDLREVEDK